LHLGLNSNRVVRSILLSASLFSILLLILSIIKMPQAKQDYRLFKAKKLTRGKDKYLSIKVGAKIWRWYIKV